MAKNNVNSSNSTSSNLPTNTPTTTPFHPFSTVVNIKLDKTNYPLWLAQILPILKSRDLMGYVDGTLTKKGDLFVANYLDRMNAIADNLNLVGQSVNDNELVQIVLNNLGLAFEITPMPLSLLEDVVVDALVGLEENNNQRNQPANGEKPPCPGERIICQICGKPGHPALDCYQRMNAIYEGMISAKRLTTMSSSPIILNKQSNGTWLLDTGANAHVTPELQNLVNPKEYNGNETIGGVGPQDTEDAFSREM
ncbi:uncharacterized protein [Pyrus communis]|uniref:uncharacterized protein n=1 Tax=Pyrus communis TaxID=23211 RepID=UPI0035C000CF